MKKRNYESDFVAVMSMPAELVDVDFIIEFTTVGRNVYTVYRRGDVYVNCKAVADGEIAIIFKDHKLIPGVLKMKLTTWTNASGEMLKSVLPKIEDIELVAGAGDEITDAEIELLMPYAVIDAYDMAVKAGYKGTREEYMSALESLPYAINGAVSATASAEQATTFANEQGNRAKEQADRVEEVLPGVAGAISGAVSATTSAGQATAFANEQGNRAKEQADRVEEVLPGVAGAISGAVSATTSAERATAFANEQGNRAKEQADRVEEVLPGVVDKIDKVVPERVGNIPTLTADGYLKDSLVNINTFMEDLYAYGAEWDIAVASSEVKRIGNLALHRNLPIQSKMRKCLLKDNGEVNYYLDPNPIQNMITSNWVAQNATVAVNGNVIRGQANTTSVGQLAYIYNNVGVKIELNKEYTLSFYARANAKPVQNLRVYDSAGGSYYVNKSINFTSEWQLFTEKFIPVENKGTNTIFVRFTCGGSASELDTTSWLELRGVKLEQSILKEDGTTAELTGADGQVMVEIPQHYRKFETEGNIRRVKMSELPLQGYHLVPKVYVSAYEASLDRVSNKLSSVVTLSADYRGGNNTVQWDNTYRSLLGMPATNVSLNNFRTYARNRGAYGYKGAGWNAYTYDAHKAIYWLYLVEYANRNCQLPFNPQPDANGFKQGGLGEGVTIVDNTKWENVNNRNPIIPCGYTNSLGNASGTVDYTLPAEYGSALTVKVPNYRGIENIFGHLYKWADGINIDVKTDAEGGTSKIYTTLDPAKFNGLNYDGYDYKWLEARVVGFIRDILFGEFGDITSTLNSGSSNTYFCDYNSQDINTSALRVIHVGGSAQLGNIAGLLYYHSGFAPTYNIINASTRLTFIPN